MPSYDGPMSHHVMSCHAIPRYAMLCHVTFCHVMSRGFQPNRFLFNSLAYHREYGELLAGGNGTIYRWKLHLEDLTNSVGFFARQYIYYQMRHRISIKGYVRPSVRYPFSKTIDYAYLMDETIHNTN